MRTALFLGLSLLLTQIPKNNPNGIWSADTGSQFELRLTGADLHVQIVEGSNPKYLKYEVDLKNDENEANTYKGSGYFVAKLSNGKECKYDTEWMFIVVSPSQILGSATSIIPEPGTCSVKERSQMQLNLKKK